jgi:hypothetical protein
MTKRMLIGYPPNGYSSWLPARPHELHPTFCGSGTESSSLNITFIEPMLLLRKDKLPEAKSWLYEIKLAGYRALADLTIRGFCSRAMTIGSA